MTDDQIWWFIGALQVFWFSAFIRIVIELKRLRSEVAILKNKIPSIWR